VSSGGSILEMMLFSFVTEANKSGVKPKEIAMANDL
jgi:hypothetical protein